MLTKLVLINPFKQLLISYLTKNPSEFLPDGFQTAANINKLTTLAKNYTSYAEPIEPQSITLYVNLTIPLKQIPITYSDLYENRERTITNYRFMDNYCRKLTILYQNANNNPYALENINKISNNILNNKRKMLDNIQTSNYIARDDLFKNSHIFTNEHSVIYTQHWDTLHSLKSYFMSVLINNNYPIKPFKPEFIEVAYKLLTYIILTKYFLSDSITYYHTLSYKNKKIITQVYSLINIPHTQPSANSIRIFNRSKTEHLDFIVALPNTLILSLPHIYKKRYIKPTKEIYKINTIHIPLSISIPPKITYPDTTQENQNKEHLMLPSVKLTLLNINENEFEIKDIEQVLDNSDKSTLEYIYALPHTLEQQSPMTPLPSYSLEYKQQQKYNLSIQE